MLLRAPLRLFLICLNLPSCQTSLLSKLITTCLSNFTCSRPVEKVQRMPNKQKGKVAKNEQLASAMANVREAVESSDDEQPPSTSAMLKEMSEAILKTINDRFDQFETKFASLQSSQNALTARMDSIDEKASDHECRLAVMEKTMGKLQTENTRLRAKTNDLEGRSRRNNIKIVGIPEGEEKGRPTEFISAIFPTLLGESHFPKPVVIDRAHRTLQPKPAEGARPRTFIARVHHYQEKETIMRLARQQRNLTYNGQRVFIYPDYTAEVMEQRRAFREIMQALRESEIKHSLRFPAKLHLQHNGQPMVFTSPGDAKTFVDRALSRNAGNG